MLRSCVLLAVTQELSVFSQFVSLFTCLMTALAIVSYSSLQLINVRSSAMSVHITYTVHVPQEVIGQAIISGNWDFPSGSEDDGRGRTIKDVVGRGK